MIEFHKKKRTVYLTQAKLEARIANGEIIPGAEYVIVDENYEPDYKFKGVFGVSSTTYDAALLELEAAIPVGQPGWYAHLNPIGLSSRLAIWDANELTPHWTIGTAIIAASNVPFNGSGTNYLNAKTEVEGAIKELDTRVKTNADDVALKVNTSDIVNNLTSTDTNKPLSANQGRILQNTTAKLAVSNVFTQPQQVPNATLPQHTTNLSQVETMFEMFKQQLRGYNLAMPDLAGKTDLGGGNYRLYNAIGITIDYNVNSGIYTINGTTTQNEFIYLTDNDIVEPDTIISRSYDYINGSISGYLAWSMEMEPNTYNDIMLSTQNEYVENTLTKYVGAQGLSIRLYVLNNNSFDNFQFKLKLEKGSQATPYTVPGQIPQYKIVGEA